MRLALPRAVWSRSWPQPLSSMVGRLTKRGLLSTVVLVATVSALGSVVGLLRDLVIARYFGASGQTDAFVVAWTIPETAFPLLMDGAMVYLLVPLFSRELAAHESLRPTVASTLPMIASVLGLLTLLTIVGAPEFVHLLTPGLADPDLAVRGVRVTAVTILAFGLAGYLMAALRTVGVFVVPAWSSLGWNVGIVAVVVALHRPLGVFSAAIGLAVGGAVTVLIQVPTFLRRVGLPRLRLRPRRDRHLLVQLTVFVPIAAYTLTRQALVYVERYFGSELIPGAITLLNYAEKVAQFAVVAAVTAAAVGFPALARAAATGGRDAMKSAVEHHLRLAILLILPATAFLVSQAEGIMTLLFTRGAFTAADASASGHALAVFSVGLVGQIVVAVGALAFFATKGVVWPPAIAGVVALMITAVLDAATVAHFGILGLAAGNAAGILVMGGLFLYGLRRWVAPIGLLGMAGHLTRCALASAAAAVPAVLLVHALPSSWPRSVTLGSAGLVMSVASVLLLAVFGVPELRSVLVATRRRLGYGY